MKIIYYQILKDRTCNFVYVHPVSDRAYTANCKDIDETMEKFLIISKAKLIPKDQDIDYYAKEYNTTVKL
jgi:hypothetical protein